MKGVVFDEFVAMVEERFSLETADRIIGASQLSTGGAYTSVGTYDHHELFELVRRLSDETGHSVPELLHTFGAYLFKRFCHLYPQYIGNHHSTFSLLGESYFRCRSVRFDMDIRRQIKNVRMPVEQST